MVRQSPCCCQRDRLDDAALDRWRAPLAVHIQIYNKPNDGKTKNNHFEDLIDPAKAGEFQPEYAIFDGWYSSLANGRPIQSDDTMADKTQANRRVNPNRARKRPVGDCDIAGNRYNSLS